MDEAVVAAQVVAASVVAVVAAEDSVDEVVASVDEVVDLVDVGPAVAAGEALEVVEGAISDLTRST